MVSIKVQLNMFMEYKIDRDFEPIQHLGGGSNDFRNSHSTW